MRFKEKKIKVRKYRKNPFKTYEPSRRINVKKEYAVPFFIRIFGVFLFLGGMVSFFVSSLFIGLKGILGIRDKSRKMSRGKIIEVRIKK